MTPFGDAMGLIDGKEGHIQELEEVYVVLLG